MTGYDFYNMIFESLENKVSTGELTEEQAIELNDIAYERYCGEGQDCVGDDCGAGDPPEEESCKTEKRKDKEDCDCGEEDCPICSKKKLRKREEDSVEDIPEENDAAEEDIEAEERCESVSDNSEVMLHVYEAFIEGRIDENEKDLFLTVLE